MENKNSSRNRWQFVRDFIILFFSGFLLILRLLNFLQLRAFECYSEFYSTPVICIGNARFELIVCGIVLILIGYDLYYQKITKKYFALLKRTWPMLLFLVFIWLSNIWSIAPVVTLTKSIIVTSVSLTAVYFALRFTLKQWIDILSIFFGVLAIVSLFEVVFFPTVGTHNGHEVWKGIFWHRNFLGSYMAYGSFIFLMRLQLSYPRKLPDYLVNIFFFTLMVILVLGSRSVLGLLTMGMLCFLTILIWVILKWGLKIKKIYYWISGFLGAGVFIFILAKFPVILELLNRSQSWGFREELWRYILQNTISQRPLFGHGYGAVWSFFPYRYSVGMLMGWRFQALFGDNGYIDVLIHLGIIGLIFLIGMLFWAGISTVKFVKNRKELIYFLPVITLVFFIISNISLSLIVESEYTIWLLLIVAASHTLGGIFPDSNGRITQEISE